MSNVKKIYPVHEYGDETHFKALYDCANKYGYEVEGQIILRRMAIIKKYAKAVIQRHQFFSGTKQFLIDIRNHRKLKKLHGEILIVGIAPYDTLLNKYSSKFKDNYSFYFTSHLYWDGTKFPRGTIDNKSIFERLLGECFKGAFCVSKMTENQVRKYIQNTCVVNHAISYESYCKSVEVHNNPRRYIFTGGYTERKNIRLILKWLKKHPYEQVQIDFAGDGPLRELVNEITKTDNRLTNLGFCSKKKLQQILCTYDFMLLPSKDEPFGISLLESLAAGTPCIVSDAIGPTEIITDGYDGFIFKLTDEENDFDCVMKKSLSCSEQELALMRKNALTSGYNYDSNEIVKRWIRLIEKNNVQSDC